MTPLVFVDTEFTNFKKPDLISIGCAPLSNDCWYSENSDFDKSGSTEWVERNIYPRLQGGHYTMPRKEIAETLWAWFDRFDVIVIVDYHRDRQLLLELFDYVPHPKIKSICNVFQTFAQSHAGEQFSKLEDRYEKLINFYFELTPIVTRHNALFDAMALKYAFQKVVQEFNLKESDYV